MNKPQQSDKQANDVIAKMMENDLFSQWLGIKIISIKEGYSHLQLTLRTEMLNGFNIIHGGIIYSFADSAFAFACNSYNNISVALDVSITYAKPCNSGDTITAEASEVHNGNHTGLYLVTVCNQQNEPIALFKGTCFRTGKTIL